MHHHCNILNRFWGLNVNSLTNRLPCRGGGYYLSLSCLRLSFFWATMTLASCSCCRASRLVVKSFLNSYSPASCWSWSCCLRRETHPLDTDSQEPAQPP